MRCVKAMNCDFIINSAGSMIHYAYLANQSIAFIPVSGIHFGSETYGAVY
jgi:hypothetical protein